LTTELLETCWLQERLLAPGGEFLLAMLMREQGPPREGRGEGHDHSFSADDKQNADAAETARYIADMTTQMEAMAGAAKLDFLAYLLGMVRAESEAVARRGGR
jgi:hypothetical protein